MSNKVITGRLTLFLIAILLISLIPAVYAQANSNNTNIVNTTSNQTEDKTLYFFYGQECPHCREAEPFLEELRVKYNLTIKSYETWHNASNKKIFEQFLVSHNVSKNSWGVPGFFMGNRQIIGFDNKEGVGKNLELMIQDCLQNKCQEKPNTEQPIRFNFFGKNIELNSHIPIILLGMILGFADGLFPCTMAILLFLMSYLFTISASRKKVLRLGLIFVFTIYIVYVLIMLGLINLLPFIDFKGVGKTVIGILLLVVAVISLKDFFLKDKGPSLAIPKFAKPTLEKLIKRATIPAIILLAIILSFVVVGCTLGLPLIYVTLMYNNGITGFTSFIYILWYNLFYIMPLVIILLLVYFLVLGVDKAEKYREKLKGYIKLAGGILMLIFALALIFKWI